MTVAFPLQWPPGWPVTPFYGVQRARFDTTFSSARDGLMRELELLGATAVVLSTNVETRLDGLPYAGRRKPIRPGAAVYFVRRGKQVAIACDKWDVVDDNIQALRKTVEAIRGIERWGASEMLDRAFAGFEALPPAPSTRSQRPWHEVLCVPPDASLTWCRAEMLKLAKRFHPDSGTEPDAGRMAEVNDAFAECERLGGLR